MARRIATGFAPKLVEEKEIRLDLTRTRSNMIVRTGLGFTLNFTMLQRIVSRSYLTLRTGYVYKLVPLDGYHRSFMMPSKAELCYYS